MIDPLLGMAATISGRVQGVYFRESTKKLATKLTITGWVANNPDGTVQLKAYGTRVQLDQLLSWLHKGPLLARVTRVDTQAIPYAIFDQFDVRHHR